MAALDKKTGDVLWRSTEVVNSPIIQGSFVYTTVGAGQGCDLLHITRDGDKFQAEPVYSHKNMLNHHGNVALVGERIFGFSEGKGWMCQAFASGEIVWTEKSKLRAGSLTYADGRIYCFGEDDGTTVLIDASLTGWTESGRFRIPQQSTLRKPSGKIWPPCDLRGPAVSAQPRVAILLRREGQE